MSHTGDDKESRIQGMDIREVLAHLPHRYPFLLIDRVIECIPGKSLIALKNVSYNEPYFVGHFPQRPVMLLNAIGEARPDPAIILGCKRTNAAPSDGALYY